MSFNTEHYLNLSQKLDLSDIDWTQVRKHSLNEDEIRFLQYAMEIEDHTIVYLKELLRTDAIKDPEVTAFLTCWAYEEHYHGRALERILHEYLGPDAPRRNLPERLRREGGPKRIAKAMLMPLISRLAPDFTAVHMTWGATNELTTLTGYEQMIRKSNHPIFKEILTRIVRDERRHYAFYYNQAKTRLQNPRNQPLTRFLMKRAWKPVGLTVYDPLQIEAVSKYAFGDAEGKAAIASANAQIASLPGMQGWNKLKVDVEAGAQRASAA